MNPYYHKEDYQIRVGGIISKFSDERLIDWSRETTDDGNTLLSASDIDSAALFGALAALRDGGYLLVSVLKGVERV